MLKYRKITVTEMTKLQKNQAAIQSLSSDEFTYLRNWMIELDWEEWDRQIEKDSASGKLDFLVNEALAAKAQDELQEL